MDTKKVVIVLLIIAIVFSVLTLVVTFVMPNGGEFVGPRVNYNYKVSQEQPGGGSIGVTVLSNNLILGVLHG